MIFYLIYDKGGEKNCWEAVCRDFSQSHFRGLTDISWVPFQVFIVESSFYDNPWLTRTRPFWNGLLASREIASSPRILSCGSAWPLTSISQQKRQIEFLAKDQ